MMAKIPDHDDEALDVFKDYGVHVFDYAKFMNPEKTKILAYKRCGRGYSKSVWELLRDDANG